MRHFLQRPWSTGISVWFVFFYRILHVGIALVIRLFLKKIDRTLIIILRGQKLRLLHCTWSLLLRRDFLWIFFLLCFFRGRCWLCTAVTDKTSNTIHGPCYYHECNNTCRPKDHNLFPAFPLLASQSALTASLPQLTVYIISHIRISALSVCICIFVLCLFHTNSLYGLFCNS